MGIDSAGEYVTTRRVDHAVSRHIQVLSNGGHALVLDENIRVVVIHCSNNSPVLHQQGHNASLNALFV
jgi:hypothetical protein